MQGVITLNNTLTAVDDEGKTFAVEVVVELRIKQGSAIVTTKERTHTEGEGVARAGSFYLESEVQSVTYPPEIQRVVQAFMAQRGSVNLFSNANSELE